MSNRLDYRSVNDVALPYLLAILRRWLPDGRIVGNEYIVRNPTRIDHHPGSFRINIRTGRWADFATDHKGRDVIGLAAYLAGCSRHNAARWLRSMLRVEQNNDGC